MQDAPRRTTTTTTTTTATVTSSGTIETTRQLTLGLINGGSAFYTPVFDGYNATCSRMNLTCWYDDKSSYSENATCIDVVRGLVRQWLFRGVNGIAVKPCTEEAHIQPMRDLYDEAWNKFGVPMVTFDSDTANATRVAYIGTDNHFMGRTMAKLLRQLRPDGGTFAKIGGKMERDAGFREEIFKYNNNTDRPHWYEMEKDFEALGIPADDYMGIMESFAEDNPTAMVIMIQTPMRHPDWTQFIDANRFRNMTVIGSDGADYQLTYLNQRYVDGLVGQLPYEIGTEAVKVLYKAITEGRNSLPSDVISTNVVAYNLIPLELPHLDVDENTLGNLKYLGYICFASVAVISLSLIVWTIDSRKSLVVKAAQPFFLIMIAVGILIMSSSLIPLSFDDGGGSKIMSHTYSVGICMSTPWLAFVGFAITFSALFSKTWRINQIFSSTTQFARVQVSEKDVLAPFACLLICNIAILLCWTLIDPLKYYREENEGMDYWNRIISTYGSCRSNHAASFLVPLGVINLIAVAISCWQAFRARNIASEFSEAKYIGLSVGSMTQAFLTGIPVVVVVKHIPRTYYVVLTLMIYILSMTVLLLIFLPKIMQHRDYSKMSKKEQNEMIKTSLRTLTTEGHNSGGFRTNGLRYSFKAAGFSGRFKATARNSGHWNNNAMIHQQPEDKTTTERLSGTMNENVSEAHNFHVEPMIISDEEQEEMEDRPNSETAN
jgi:ABC-type sugar transport system substrate-binding protein